VADAQGSVRGGVGQRGRPALKADEDGVLDATTVLEELRRRCGDTYGPSQLRTLRRRMHDWRRLHGPQREVFFEQVPVAGREGAFDFTDATELGVTIAGQAFVHQLFEFVLAFSADFAHRGQPYRRIVITRFGHRDRSGATQAVGRSVGGFGLGSPA
jgi:hypothetical protein